MQIIFIVGLPDNVNGVDATGYPNEQGQTDVDPKVRLRTFLRENCKWG